MIHYENRLNKLFFAICLEEEIHNISALMTLFKSNIMLFGKRSRLFKGLDLLEIDA